MLEIANIVVTIISIIAALCSMKNARKAKQYKEDTLLLTDTFDLERFIVKFQIESESFLAKTRKPQWNRGVDTNSIISPFKGVLSSFGRVYHLVSNPEELKHRVHTLNEIVQTYYKANSEERKQVNSLIIEITEILQQVFIHKRDRITMFS